MIKKLQRRFIILTMSSLFTVLLVIISGINIVYYQNTIKEADRILAVLDENDGTFPELKKEKPDDERPDNSKPPADDPFSSKDDPGPPPEKNSLFSFGKFSKETPYESRFFSVLINKETGTLLETDINHIASVDEETAYHYASQILEKEKTAGFIEHFRYLCTTEDGHLRIIFLDCGKSLDSVRNFIFISTGISLLGFTIVTLIIIVFSNRIIKPVSESYQKQKRFITDASHEIKTPLTIINADADILEMELEENEWISDIKRQTGRLTELTNNLILLTRMEETENSIQKIEFPISDVVTEAVLSFQSLAQTQNKTLDLKIEPMLSLNGDSKRIHQLMMLLMDNALKYSPENSSISVSLEKKQKNSKNGVIYLYVANKTLTPLSKEDTQSLFDRFYRVDSSRSSSTGGYGIGLSVAKAIVESHGGKIRAVTTDSDVLTIQMQFPL